MWDYIKMWNWGGRIGMIAGIIGGAIGAIAAIIAAPVFGTIFTVIFIAIFYFAFKFTLGPEVQSRRIIENGEDATAVILKVTETGWTVNNMYYIVKFMLEVHPNGKPVYQTETQGMISRLTMAQFQAGMTVPIRIDRKDPKKVALIENTEAGASPAVPASSDAQAGASPEQVKEIEAQVEAKDKMYAEIRAKGEAATAVILRCWEMGIFVNGNNPLMGFLLEVHPANKPAFTAETQGVIQESSKPKYQPGKTVYVKFDPSDQSKVSLDHS